MGGRGVCVKSVCIFILIGITFINLARTNETFLFAYGLFQDVWAPMMEAALNLGLSVVLGYFWGLSGILSGVIISLLLIVCGWKPIFCTGMGSRRIYWNM